MHFGQHRTERRKVGTMYCQQHLPSRTPVTREWILHPHLHPLIDDPTGKGETVGVQSIALERHEHVPVAYPRGPEYRVLVDVSDDEAGEIIVRRRIYAGHFSRLAPEQRTAILATPRGDAGDDTLDGLRIQRAERPIA